MITCPVSLAPGGGPIRRRARREHRLMPIRCSVAVRLPVLRLAALALVCAAAAGCAPDPVAPAPAPVRTEAVGAAAASSPAAELQAALTALLVERTYVVAAATSAVAATGGRRESAPAAAALEALDESSAGLADVLGATYSGARGPLLDALQRADALIGEHAVALGSGDSDGAAAARTQLRRAEDDLAQVVRRVVPQLDAAEVADRFAGQVQAQLAAGTGTQYAQLRAAAQQAGATARLLSAGIADDRRLGSPGAGAARLRADVTGLLVEHVALVGALAGELRTSGPAADEARAALQGNAVALADVVGDAYPAARGAFLRSWTAHLDRLRRYAAARATGGAGTAEAGLVRGYSGELARLLAEHVDGLPARSATTELEPALASLLDAVAAQAAASPEGPAALHQAAQDVLPAAALVSAAVAEDLQLP